MNYGFYRNSSARSTFTAGNTAYTTDQQQSLFQVPLGVSLRYRFFYALLVTLSGY